MSISASNDPVSSGIKNYVSTQNQVQFHDMEPEALAIRFPSVKAGPRSLRGTNPIAVFATQNQVGAELEQASFPARVGGGELALPSRIAQVGLVQDYSSSMRCAVTPSDRRSKLQYLRDELERFDHTVFNETDCFVVLLNDDCERVALTSHQFSAVKGAIANIIPSGGTKFENALAMARDIFREKPKDVRKFLMFDTDGHNQGERKRALELAAEIREENVGVILLGLGADYDIHHVFELAGMFGYCTWAHMPVVEGEDVFNTSLPRFIANMQTADNYLQVSAKNLIAAYAISPTIRRADNGVINFGYQTENLGICFAGARDPSLRLRIKSHVSDDHPTTKHIPIIDFEAAAPYFEMRQAGQAALGPLLVFLSQLEGDLEALAKLREDYTVLREHIDKIFALQRAPQNEHTRLVTRADISNMASMTGREMTRVNALSCVPRFKIPPLAKKPHLHSGYVAPIEDAPPTSIPELGIPNPSAYGKVESSGLNAPHVVKRIDVPLSELRTGQTVVIGRMKPCPIVIEHPSISRFHLRLFKAENGFYICDLGSSYGTFLNGKRLKLNEQIKLNDGDAIVIGQVALTFKM